MATKYYAIAVGKKTGIFTNNWDDLKGYVNGFPGAKYKSFFSKRDAQAFIDLHSGDTSSKKTTTKSKEYYYKSSSIVPKSKYKKYYAIARGKKTGIFTDDWDKLKDYITGYPKPKFKSFATEEDAQVFMNQFADESHRKEIVTDPADDGYLRAYTDGSYKEDIAGYGVVIEDTDGVVHKFSGQLPEVYDTNNQAELWAVGKALAYTEGDIIIHTDSMYAINSLTEWMEIRKRDGWSVKEGNSVKEIKNRELIEEIYYELMKDRSVKFKYVRGHSGNVFNEIADRLADEGRLLDPDETLLDYTTVEDEE